MSRQAEAAQILSEVVRDLSSPGRDIKLALRKCLHAYQVIGFDEGTAWIRRELEGYPLELGLPAYRSVPGVLEWRMAAMPTQPSEDLFARVLDLSELSRLGFDSTTLELRAGIDWIIGASKRGYSEQSGETTSARTERGGVLELARMKVFSPEVFASLLNRLEHAVLEHASKNYTFLMYGEALTHVWEGYRQEVDAKLSDLNYGNHLKTIQNGIRSTNPEDWRLAAYGCRNLFEDVAAYLWQDPRPTYDLLPGKAKNGHLEVTQDKYLNRLSAYLHQQEITRSSGKFLHVELQRLDASIRALVSDQSKGHGPITLVEVQQVAIATYFILGALVTRTDMVPINSYRLPGEDREAPAE